MPGHRFVSEEEFTRAEREGRFLDVVRPFGLPARYGLPVLEKGDEVADLVLLRAPFVERLREVVPALLVVQLEAPESFRLRRLRARGLAEDELVARCESDEQEASAGRAIADAVIRNDASLADACARAIELLARTHPVAAA